METDDDYQSLTAWAMLCIYDCNYTLGYMVNLTAQSNL